MPARTVAAGIPRVGVGVCDGEHRSAILALTALTRRPITQGLTDAEPPVAVDHRRCGAGFRSVRLYGRVRDDGQDLVPIQHHQPDELGESDHRSHYGSCRTTDRR